MVWALWDGPFGGDGGMGKTPCVLTLKYGQLGSDRRVGKTQRFEREERDHWEV